MRSSWRFCALKFHFGSILTLIHCEAVSECLNIHCLSYAMKQVFSDSWSSKNLQIEKGMQQACKQVCKCSVSHEEGPFLLINWSILGVTTQRNIPRVKIFDIIHNYLVWYFALHITLSANNLSAIFSGMLFSALQCYAYAASIQQTRHSKISSLAHAKNAFTLKKTLVACCEHHDWTTWLRNPLFGEYLLP